MLEFQCPHCKEILNIPEQFVGSTGTCRKCRNSITIELQPVTTSTKAGMPIPFRPPTLAALHIETTGPASRRHNIIELAGIKVDVHGRELDTFWSLANPDEPVPEDIVERTDITDDMVAQSPFSFEVVREWFDWIGDRALLFSDHAHFHAKFLCATLLKEDIEPPMAHIVDVVHWAEDLHVPTEEYRLRPLLEAIGYGVKPAHRALDTAKGIVALAGRLLALEEARLGTPEEKRGLGRLLGKKASPGSEELIYQALMNRANTLEDMCGPNFYARRKYEERRRVSESVSGGNGEQLAAPLVLHLPEWYEEKRRVLGACLEQEVPAEDDHNVLTPDDGPWASALARASEELDPEEQRAHLMEAISLGARDPWPYDRLVGFYIRAKDYASAQQICQQYFEGESWKLPRYVDSSIRLLDRLHKLERRLARVS